MKSFFKLAPAFAFCAALAFLHHPVLAQFPAVTSDTGAQAQQVGGPVAVGQQMAQRDDGGRVAIVQAAAVSQQGGGVIQLSAFGWLEPYVDTIVQALIAAGLAWLGKSKYTQWMDETARDALETFLKNSASSLIADGFVQMRGKSVQVSDAAVVREVSAANARIPDALKRFGITPDVLAAKIVDAIPQTPAGAAIVASSHQDAPAKSSDWVPPTTGST